MIIRGADFSSVAVVESVITVVASPSEGGSVTGGGLYLPGDQAVLRAVAAIGYSFSRWNDGNTSPTRTVVVGDENVTYTAFFAEEGSKPSVDTNVLAEMYAENHIFIANRQDVGVGIDTMLVSNAYTSGFDVYKAAIVYYGAKYRISLYDNLGNDSGADIYKFAAICDQYDNIIAYVLKRDIGTGRGDKTFEVDMLQYPGAAYIYISTYNDVISVTALAD